jgi:hypothetical protein
MFSAPNRICHLYRRTQGRENQCMNVCTLNKICSPLSFSPPPPPQGMPQAYDRTCHLRMFGIWRWIYSLYFRVFNFHHIEKKGSSHDLRLFDSTHVWGWEGGGVSASFRIFGYSWMLVYIFLFLACKLTQYSLVKILIFNNCLFYRT